MARSRVNIKGVSKFRNTEIIQVGNLSRRQLEVLALSTERVIKEKITESIQRPGSTGNLANSFFAERITDSSWGVGNISFLNSKAPYWRWINFGVAGTGRKVPPKSIGSFNPAPGAPSADAFGTGRFQQNSGPGGGFLLIPTKAIEPHNYIQRTLAEVRTLIASALKTVRRR